jgi:hypothetical protein
MRESAKQCFYARREWIFQFHLNLLVAEWSRIPWALEKSNPLCSWCEHRKSRVWFLTESVCCTLLKRCRRLKVGEGISQRHTAMIIPIVCLIRTFYVREHFCASLSGFGALFTWTEVGTFELGRFTSNTSHRASFAFGALAGLVKVLGGDCIQHVECFGNKVDWFGLGKFILFTPWNV